MEAVFMSKEKKYMTHETKMVFAYNMKIIETLWKDIKGDLGRNIVRGNENDTNSLYGSLEKSKQTIYEIINAEKDFEVDKINEWACLIEKKTGIPKEYLTGKERIKLGESFEQDYYSTYEDYIACCDTINEFLSIAKEKPVNWSAAKIKKLVHKTKSKKDVEEFDKANKEATKTLEIIETFNEELKKEIDRVKEIAPVRGLRENPKRYKLIYFIKYGKKQDAIGIEKVQDIMRVMEDIRTAQLKDLGEAGLRLYIETLKKHLKLAESVYTVAVDCGNFKI